MSSLDSSILAKYHPFRRKGGSEGVREKEREGVREGGREGERGGSR